MGLLADIKDIPLNVGLCIGAAVAAAGAFGWFVEHERGIGEAKCESAQVAVNDAAQAAADKEAPLAIAAVHEKYDPVNDAITHYGTSINEDLADPKKVDPTCAPVPYVRALRVDVRPSTSK